MSWRERVEEALRGEGQRDTRDTRDTNPSLSPPSVPSVPFVPANPSVLLRSWGDGLSRVDPEAAPDGFTAKGWWQLWLDACWLAESHGRYASLNGWDSSGLFGVHPDCPYSGGLAQLLQSCRSVVLDGPHAYVTSYGVRMKRNTACGIGLPLIWELGK